MHVSALSYMNINTHWQQRRLLLESEFGRQEKEDRIEPKQVNYVFLISEGGLDLWNANLNERRTAWIPHVTNVLIRNASMVIVLHVIVTYAKIA